MRWQVLALNLSGKADNRVPGLRQARAAVLEPADV
jgi:hypothetical protein